MVALPSDRQVAGVIVIVGTAGVVNLSEILNEVLAEELHEPIEATSVYEVPAVILMIDPELTLGPVGEKT